jgi:hypothetical protein
LNFYNTFKALACCVALLLLCSASTNECKIKNKSFTAGESITYKVYYHLGAMNVGAGEATFATSYERYNNKPAFHFTGSGKTYKSYDWFFKVRDLYQSYVDTNTMLPMRFLRDVSEGNTKFKHDVTFNHGLKTAKSTKSTTTITSCCQDVLSMIYWSRNIDFEKMKSGDKFNFDMYIDDQVYPLYIKYLGKEKIVTDLGTFNCVKFRPQLIEGTMFKGGEQMVVWATDDANHIPVRIEASITVGEIRADMLKATGLRHGLTSWVKKYYDKK